MTITEFRLEIAGLLNRDPAKFVVNGTDLIVNAVNRGMSVAQRLVNFERLRTTIGPVSVNLSTGADLSSYNVNVIKAGYLEFTNPPAAIPILPIQYVTKNQYLDRARRRIQYDTRTRLPIDASRIGLPFDPVFYKQNNQIFLWPTDSNLWQGTTAVNMGLDVIAKDNPFSYLSTYSLSYIGSLAYCPPVLPDDEGDPNPQASFVQNGSWNGQPLFASANGAWLSYTGTVWIAGPSLFPSGDYWQAPVSGINGLDSTLPWIRENLSIPAGNYFQRNAGLTVVNYTVGSQPASFWLDECQEWLQLYVIQYLQTHYIKAADKWPVTQQMVNAAWQGVVSWNDSISDQEVPYDLE